MDNQLRELLRFAEFKERVCASIIGLRDETAIYGAVRAAGARSRRYAAAILLLAADGSHLRIAETPLSSRRLKALEAGAGIRLDDCRIALNESSILERVVRQGETIHAESRDLAACLGPEPLAILVTQRPHLETLHSVGTPLRRRGQVIGAIVISSTDLNAYAVPFVRSLGWYVSSALDMANARAERLRMEAELRESERTTRALLDATDDSAFLIDTAGTMLAFNEHYRQRKGLSADKLLGCLVYDTVPPALAATRHERVDSAVAAGQPLRFEDEDRGRCLEHSVYPILSSDGKVAKLAVYSRDVTARKRAEQELLRRSQELSSLYDTALELTSHLDLQELLHALLARTTELMSGTASAIYLYRPEHDDMQVAAGHGFAERFVGRVLARGEGMAGRVLESGQPLIVSDYSTWPGGVPAYQQAPFGAVLTVPIRWRGQFLGTINTNRAHGATYSEDDVRLLTLFANQAAVALANARTHAALQRELEERKRDQDQIRREIARSQALLRVAMRLNIKLDLHTVLHALCEETRGALHAPAVSVTLFEPERDVLVLAAQSGLSEDYIARSAPTPRALHDQLAGRDYSFITLPDAQAVREPALPNADLYSCHNIRTIIVASLVHGGNLLGTLNLYSMGEPRSFEDDELELLKGLAEQAALAIANARLLQQVHAAEKQLEALSHRLLEVQETERRYIARELHDEIGQALTGLKLLLETSAGLPLRATEARLGEAQALAAELMTRVRDLSLNLRPAMLDDLGLLPTLEWHFDRYRSQSGVLVEFKHTGLEGRFDSAIESAAYRIVQEALTNVARHAGVGQVTVRVWANEQMLGVQVLDTGRGFDPATVLSSPQSSGLRGMRERATLLGGTLSVESALAQGVCLTAELPLDRGAQWSAGK